MCIIQLYKLEEFEELSTCMTCGTEPDQYRENTILGNKGPYSIPYDLES